jgi:hypothetical protein
MAGGIFVDQPYHPNPKCLVFAISLMIAYWCMPKKNPFLLPLIFVIAYIAMAWYDYLYNCDMQLYSGTSIGPNTLDTWGKPQRRTKKPSEPKEDVKLLSDQEAAYKRNVYLFHIIAIMPILLYIGFRKKQSNSQIFALLFGVGLIALIYHGMRMFVDREVTSCPEEKKEEVKIEISYLKSVYFMHVAAIVPLFLYVGYKGNQSDPRAYAVILSLGIITGIYHTFRVFYPRSTINCIHEKS